TYLLISPLTVLHWPAAQWAWLGVNLACTGAVIVAGLRLLRIRDPRLRMAWVIVALLFQPVHTTVSQGQLSLVCVALMFAGLVCLKGRRDLIAGILLGTAAALKPQVGGVL